MKIKIDEQLSELLKEPLIKSGHEAATVLDEGLSGKLDEELWPVVKRENRFLITADKEFGNIRKYPPGTHAGVLLLRPDNESIQSYLKLVEFVLKESMLENLSKKTAVITDRGLRVRTS